MKEKRVEASAARTNCIYPVGNEFRGKVMEIGHWADPNKVANQNMLL